MSKLSILTLALITGLGINAIAFAQSPAPTTSGQTSQDSQKAPDHVPKPGDRNCIHDTGSLIPAKKGECLPVPGRSYSGDELRGQGTNGNNARALQMLDPSVSVGH
ncbi:MAG: hypothetical protein WAM90_00955 [Rhodanobacter sp.]